MSYVMSRAIRAAAAGNRGRQAPRPAKRPGAPLSFTEAMDPARRREWTRATFGTGTARAGAAVAVPETAPVAAPTAAPVTLGRPQPIDGARVLNQVYGYLGHMAVWPSGWAQITAALYAAHAHAKDDNGMPVWQYEPRLFFTSRTGGSGKSWLARQVAALCPDGKGLVEMTKASLIDLIAQHATVTIGEMDVLVGSGKRTQWLTGIANAGYEPDRMTSRKHGGKVQEIPLFGPMILDGLDSVIHQTGEDLKTLMSRCIIVHTERAPEGYRPPRFDREKRAIAAALNGRLARWMAQEVEDGIGDVVPELPEGIGNRPAALWEPLIAVADAAGGHWPALARGACERLESATGLPGEDEAAEARIDSALSAWDADEPAWPDAD